MPPDDSPYRRLALLALALDRLGLSESDADDLIVFAADYLGNLDYAVEYMLIYLEVWCRREMACDARARGRWDDPSGRWAG